MRAGDRWLYLPSEDDATRVHPVWAPDVRMPPGCGLRGLQLLSSGHRDPRRELRYAQRTMQVRRDETRRDGTRRDGTDEILQAVCADFPSWLTADGSDHLLTPDWGVEAARDISLPANQGAVSPFLFPLGLVEVYCLFYPAEAFVCWAFPLDFHVLCSYLPQDAEWWFTSVTWILAQKETHQNNNFSLLIYLQFNAINHPRLSPHTHTHCYHTVTEKQHFCFSKFISQMSGPRFGNT